MQFFLGSPALSQFRLNKLMSDIQADVPAVLSVATHYVHFADVDGKLSNVQLDILGKLLSYGPKRHDSDAEGVLFLVTPRAGTISPWSSKATDIAHNCNLSNIIRLERGIAYNISCSNNHELSEADIKLIDAVIHDRMIEMVLRDFDEADCLFEHASPIEGNTIDV